MLGCLTVLPGESQAATTYWVTLRAPSHNSTYDLYYYKYHADLSPLEAAQVHNDSEVEDLWGSVSYIHEVTTNDFTNTSEWVDPGSPPEWTLVGYMPVPTATIATVYLSVRFTTDSMPEMELAFSINNGTDWTESSTIPATTSSSDYQWDITELEDWTPAILNSTDLWAMGTFRPIPYAHHYLDYVGFTVLWYGDFVGGGAGGYPFPEGGEETEEGGAEVTYDLIYSIGGLLGILGLFGLIGMIAAPALAVYAYRHTDEGKMSLFIKMLVFFMICLSFFMVSLSA